LTSASVLEGLSTVDASERAKSRSSFHAD
jgi:hypothetical protein